jgi:hypothetical protein
VNEFEKAQALSELRQQALQEHEQRYFSLGGATYSWPYATLRYPIVLTTLTCGSFFGLALTSGRRTVAASVAFAFAAPLLFVLGRAAWKFRVNPYTRGWKSFRAALAAIGAFVVFILLWVALLAVIVWQ